MTIAYVFDVDGTMTPSRVRMDEKFRQEFLEFQETHDTYLVTGSDYPKTLEQVGEEVIARAKLVFNCCGNEVRTANHIRYKSPWKPESFLLSRLNRMISLSSFPIKTGNHIEVRTGCLNLSIVGRNATVEERAKFVEYDEEHGERLRIAEMIRPEFPEMDFTIAGETGLDIFPKGKDKAQVKDWIDKEIFFFGDKCEEGGNDFALAKVAEMVYHVRNWQETQEAIRKLTARDTNIA